MAGFALPPRQWRWLLAATLIVVAVTGAPYVLGWASAGPRTFSGFLFLVEDGNSYMSKMQQGAHGAWLFHIAYTTEPHLGTLLFLPYLALGHLAAGLSVPLPVMQQVARWAAGALVLVVSYGFIAFFVRNLWVRRLAWLLVAAGAGAGWLTGWRDWLGGQPIDLYVPEAFGVLALLYNLPHLALARAALLAGMVLLVRSFELGSARLAALAGAAWLVMVLAVPFDGAVAGAITGAYLVALAVRRRALPWREIGLAALAGIWIAPYMIYALWTAQADPVLAAWNAQNRILSPNALHYLAGYVFLLAPALYAVPWVLRGGERRLLLLAWIVAAPVLVYLPINVQRRLIEGAQVALAVLAAVGVMRACAVVARRRPRLRRALRVAPLAALLPTTLLLWAGGIMIALTDTHVVYYPPELVAVAGWLDRQAPGSNVLASYATGNALPALALVRVYVGHDPETPQAADKAAAVSRFFQAEAGDDERLRLLADGRIDYVVCGPNERALAGRGTAFDPAQADYLERVFGAGEWALYRVVAPGANRTMAASGGRSP